MNYEDEEYFSEDDLSALDDNPSQLDDCVIIEDGLMLEWNRSEYTQWSGRC